MEYLTDIDEYAAAFRKVNLNIDLNMKDSRGFLMESRVFLMESRVMECYNKARCILDVPEMITGHQFCLNLNYDELSESDIETVARLYDLGVERGFITPQDFDSDSETDVGADVCPVCGNDPCTCNAVGDVDDIGDGSEMYEMDADHYVTEHFFDNEFNPDDPANDENDSHNAEYDAEISGLGRGNEQDDVIYTKPEDDEMPFEDDAEQDVEQSTPVESPADTPAEEPDDSTDDEIKDADDDANASSETTPDTDGDTDGGDIKDDSGDVSDTQPSDAEEPVDDNAEKVEDPVEEPEEEQSDNGDDTEDSEPEAEVSDDKPQDDVEQDGNDDETEETKLTPDEKKAFKDAYHDLWRQTLRELSISSPLSDITDPKTKVEFWTKISDGWTKADPSEFMSAKEIENLETKEKVDDVKSDEEKED